MCNRRSACSLHQINWHTQAKTKLTCFVACSLHLIILHARAKPMSAFASLHAFHYMMRGRQAGCIFIFAYSLRAAI